jgi:hypothetical protein
MKKSSINYHKLNFILSVIGFVGSIIFYIGVLQKVYSKDPKDQTIQRLESELKALKEECQKNK